MSINSKIEWTQATWNPITGCTKVSDGCKNCYAERLAHRLKAMHNPRYQNEFQVTVHEDLLRKPFEWKKPKKIFVNSMSDIFHEDVPEEAIISIFETMNSCPQHQFQVLTKRPERLKSINNKVIWSDNIWMGVSVENSKYLNRIEILKDCGAKIKYVSAEPLIGDLGDINLEGIDWIIVGGESGPGSRPIKEEWVVNLLNLSRKYGVPFFFKQWGGVQKSKNGCLLKGQIIQEYPET